MTQTVVGIFDNPADTERAVADLIAAGFAREKISLITPNAQDKHVAIEGSNVEHAEDLAIGAVGGGVIGGVLGALVGMVVIALPGIGPVLAAGPLAAVLGSAGMTMALGAGAGAVGGGVLGALTWAGITHDEAVVYEELIKRGGTLVMVRADGDERERASAILHRDGAADAHTLEEEWRKRGKY